MARKETKYIVIHCSLSKPSMKVDAKVIDQWHRARGWLQIGYARVIKRDGTIEQGRGDDELQAHCEGYNHCSTSVCLVGGLSEDNKNTDNFTAEQWDSLKKLLAELVLKYPEARIVGHYELNEHKTCPNFNVRTYLLHEDIENYKFQDALMDSADEQEAVKAGEL